MKGTIGLAHRFSFGLLWSSTGSRFSLNATMNPYFRHVSFFQHRGVCWRFDRLSSIINIRQPSNPLLTIYIYQHLLARNDWSIIKPIHWATIIHYPSQVAQLTDWSFEDGIDRLNKVIKVRRDSPGVIRSSFQAKGHQVTSDVFNCLQLSLSSTGHAEQCLSFERRNSSPHRCRRQEWLRHWKLRASRRARQRSSDGHLR